MPKDLISGIEKELEYDYETDEFDEILDHWGRSRKPHDPVLLTTLTYVMVRNA